MQHGGMNGRKLADESRESFLICRVRASLYVANVTRTHSNSWAIPTLRAFDARLRRVREIVAGSDELLPGRDELEGQVSSVHGR